MVFPFARHVSERGHGHPDGFRFKVKLKTERVAIAFRFVLAYAFVRPQSEQNSSHLQIDCDRGRNFFPTTPMDFASWIEVYLGGRWHAFDPGAPGLSLQIEELQGDFDRMQGGPKLGPAIEEFQQADFFDHEEEGRDRARTGDCQAHHRIAWGAAVGRVRARGMDQRSLSPCRPRLSNRRGRHEQAHPCGRRSGG